MPAKVRTVAAVPVAVASLFVLTSCFLTPTPAPNATPTPTISGDGHELVGTVWAGTDSDGDDWTYRFEEDGTVGVTLNDRSYDDDSDLWTVADSEIVITVNGGDQFGDIIHTGEYAGLDEPMELDVRTTVGEGAWTVTIERQG